GLIKDLNSLFSSLGIKSNDMVDEMIQILFPGILAYLQCIINTDEDIFLKYPRAIEGANELV
ncbi:MAG: hypothetical protein MHPSP_002590, partial [Paramarteilia canceri]